MSETNTQFAPSPEAKVMEPIPVFVFKEHVYEKLDDADLFDRVLKVMKGKDVYRDDLIFTGFKGLPVYRNGNSFGGREITWGVSEEDCLNNIEKGEDHNPLMYLGQEGGALPALGVFDKSKLQPVMDIEKDLEVEDYWETIDGTSLDTAAVCIFYFKRNSHT